MIYIYLRRVQPATTDERSFVEVTKMERKPFQAREDERFREGREADRFRDGRDNFQGPRRDVREGFQGRDGRYQ